MFAEPSRERSFPTAAVAIATVAIVILGVFLFMFNRRHGAPDPDPRVRQPIAAYAANLQITDIQMSESTSLSGGKVTYIDGHITNHGPSTVTGINVQVLFANDQAMPPQMMSDVLNLIRTREPYVDTQAVAAAPIAPGAGADFRLIFEGINDNWNGQFPEIHIVRVTTR
jgi:hypothetical protein